MGAADQQRCSAGNAAVEEVHISVVDGALQSAVREIIAELLHLSQRSAGNYGFLIVAVLLEKHACSGRSSAGNHYGQAFDGFQVHFAVLLLLETQKTEHEGHHDDAVQHGFLRVFRSHKIDDHGNQEKRGDAVVQPHNGVVQHDHRD